MTVHLVKLKWGQRHVCHVLGVVKCWSSVDAVRQCSKSECSLAQHVIEHIKGYLMVMSFGQNCQMFVFSCFLVSHAVAVVLL